MGHDRDGETLVRFAVMVFVALFPVLMFSAGYYEGQKMRRGDVCSPARATRLLVIQ